MASFEIVDLQNGPGTRGAERAPRSLGMVDTKDIADQLETLRNDIDALFDEDQALGLKSVTVRLAVTAEGKVAFIAKGTIEASIEVTFERQKGSSCRPSSTS